MFADLLPRLADGYALQAVEWSYVAKRPRCATNDATAEEFLELMLGSRRRWVPTPGMGAAFVPTRHRIEGCGLRADGELVALSALPCEASLIRGSSRSPIPATGPQRRGRLPVHTGERHKVVEKDDAEECSRVRCDGFWYDVWSAQQKWQSY